ncbi:MAG: hypothetical protein KY475_27250, partial [Planctomycetes bacterium]|nr:hypothetical protein [Planctomycetota bacterium]
PGNSIFGSAALPAKDPVRIGVAADWLAVEIAPWRIFLAIDKKGRFPRVDDTVRSPDDAGAVVHLAEADAASWLSLSHGSRGAQSHFNR